MEFLLGLVFAHMVDSPVLKNSPTLNADYAYEIEEITKKHSKDYVVPENVIYAIMKVESNYKLNAYNPKSNDYGIMQVNKFHFKRKDKCFRKEKLLTDLDCSIKAGVIVFSEFYKKHNLMDSIAFYNCGYQKNCKNWKSVKAYVKRVKSYL